MHNAQEWNFLGKAGTRVQQGSANTCWHFLGTRISATGPGNVPKMQTEELAHATPGATPGSTVLGEGCGGLELQGAGAGGFWLLKCEADIEILLRLITQPPFQYLSQRMFLAEKYSLCVHPLRHHLEPIKELWVFRSKRHCTWLRGIRNSCI